jgi:hypothetical protein
MKKIALLLFAVAAFSTLAADTKVNGYLVDLSCANENAAKPDWGAKHTRMCLRLPDCEASGYAVLTDDKKVIRFDKAGNDEAKKFLAAITKNKDIKVTVTGAVSGDQMTVTKIDLQ